MVLRWECELHGVAQLLQASVELEAQFIFLEDRDLDQGWKINAANQKVVHDPSEHVRSWGIRGAHRPVRGLVKNGLTSIVHHSQSSLVLVSVAVSEGGS